MKKHNTVDLEQHRFELHSSTGFFFFFNKYILQYYMVSRILVWLNPQI